MSMPRRLDDSYIVLRQSQDMKQIFVDPPPREYGFHNHLWEPYGLMAHDRCKVCGIARARSDRKEEVADTV